MCPIDTNSFVFKATSDKVTVEFKPFVHVENCEFSPFSHENELLLTAYANVSAIRLCSYLLVAALTFDNYVSELAIKTCFLLEKLIVYYPPQWFAIFNTNGFN